MNVVSLLPLSYFCLDHPTFLSVGRIIHHHPCPNLPLMTELMSIAADQDFRPDIPIHLL